MEIAHAHLLRPAQDVRPIGTGPRPAAQRGFALFRKGFRPFFFLAALFAVGLVPVWLFVVAGWTRPLSAFDPYAWHANQMIFGFTTAIVAGFLLTAVANWTGKETITGAPLAALAVLWLAGRLAVSFSAVLPRGLAAVIDLAFLPLLTVAIGRPLVAKRNRRNYVMLGIVLVLFGLDLAMHLDSLGIAPGWAHRAALTAIDVLVLLVVLISGRVVPMFTRSGAQRPVGSWPWADRAAGASVALLALTGLLLPQAVGLHRALAGLAAATTLARSIPWLTPQITKAPLVWILHAAHAWIPVGFLLRALDLPGGVHALTVGAIGGMCLGMMARVALGHTGRRLEAPKGVPTAFGLLMFGAVARVAVAFLPGKTWATSALHTAGTCWALAFGLFLVGYARILFTPRVDGKAG